MKNENVASNDNQTQGCRLCWAGGEEMGTHWWQSCTEIAWKQTKAEKQQVTGSCEGGASEQIQAKSFFSWGRTAVAEDNDCAVCPVWCDISLHLCFDAVSVVPYCLCTDS